MKDDNLDNLADGAEKISQENNEKIEKNENLAEKNDEIVQNLENNSQKIAPNFARENPKNFDIFAWANQISRVKNDLDAEFFVVNKKYTVYNLPISSELKPQIAPVFVLEILNEIEKGAGLGLETREYEKSEEEPGVLLFSTRKKVANAAHILDIIENQRREIETFNEYDHEFKTIKMIIARFSHKDFADFYVAKQISGSSSLNERSAWEIGENGKLEEFHAAAAFKIPTDNQVLILPREFLKKSARNFAENNSVISREDSSPAAQNDNENSANSETEQKSYSSPTEENQEENDLIFAFAPKKFSAMFGYNYKQQIIADKKVAQILDRYQLNFPEGQDLNSLVANRPKTINKLQNLELGTKSQEEITDYSEEMALDLMTADDGAIIIMDGHDVDTFVGLLNDDFMTSDLTGLKYEIRAKKLLKGGDE